MKLEFSTRLEKPYEIDHTWFSLVYLYSRTFSWPRVLKPLAKVCQIITDRFLLALSMRRDFWTVGRYAGRPFTIRLTNSQFHSLYFDKGVYEPEVRSLISEFLPVGGTFLDVGANWGHHTLQAAIDRQAYVIALEPHPKSFTDLVRVTTELGLTDNVRCHPFALSAQAKTVYLNQKTFESGTAKIAALSQSKKPERELPGGPNQTLLYEVYAKRLVDFISKEQRIDLVKLDVEGNELSALMGMEEYLSQVGLSLIFEISPTDSWQEIKQLLGGYGFSIFNPNYQQNTGKIELQELLTPPDKRINAFATRITEFHL